MSSEYREVKYIFVIGIGGSNQASKAVWSALGARPFVYDEARPQMFFIEDLTPEEEGNLKNFAKEKLVSKNDFCVFVVSKSGTTAETLSSFEKFEKIFSKIHGDIKEQVTVISEKGSPLEILASKKGFQFLEWSNNVGGRWSAFTTPHTTPLRAAGFDIDKYIEGQEGFDENFAKDLANEILKNYLAGIEIIDLFFFDQRLEDLGKWARQLLSESLGKTNSEGVKVGLTPTVSIAPHDLHSMLELYLGGPNSRFTLFVKSPHLGLLETEIQREVIEAYQKENLPHLVYNINELNEENIGKFMKTMMQVVIKVGEGLKVDVYDQPAVEEYKNSHQK